MIIWILYWPEISESFTERENWISDSPYEVMSWEVDAAAAADDAGGGAGHPSNTQKFIDVVEACEHMRYWMVWSRGKCWKNPYTCWDKGRLCVGVFHYNIHLKSIDACQSWKTPSHFSARFFHSKNISHCLHVIPRLFISSIWVQCMSPALFRCA